MLLGRNAFQERLRSNEYHENEIPRLITKQISFESVVYKSDSFASFNNTASFPKIDLKFLNSKRYVDDVNDNNKLPKTSFQKGVVKTKLKVIEDEELDPRSKIFIEDRSSNRVYLLEFKTENATIIPLYLKERPLEENINDKCVQLRSKTIFENFWNKRARRFGQITKSYNVDKPKLDDKLSIMSFKKALSKKNKTCEEKPKKKASISDPASNIKKSAIFLTYKNVDFKIKPGLMKLKSSTPINFEADQKREMLLKDLNMQLPADLKNKAQVVVNYKGDILKVLFTLSEITCCKLKVTSSIGVTAKDENVYLKEFSTISDRKIYIAMPRSNYEYADVMIKVKQKNRTLEFNNVDPLWLVEQRKKRLKEYNRCRRKNPYDDIIDLKIGSSICYECFNCINRVKGGTLRCTVVDDVYEQWIQSIHRLELPQIDDNDSDKPESMFFKNVPDWDLILNME